MKRQFVFSGLLLMVIWLANGCQTTNNQKYCFQLPNHEIPDDFYKGHILESDVGQGTYPTGNLPLHEKEQQAILHQVEQDGLKRVGVSSLADWDVRFNHVEPGLVRVYLTPRKNQTKLAFGVIHTSRGWRIIAYQDAKGGIYW